MVPNDYKITISKTKGRVTSPKRPDGWSHGVNATRNPRSKALETSNKEAFVAMKKCIKLPQVSKQPDGLVLRTCALFC